VAVSSGTPDRSNPEATSPPRASETATADDPRVGIPRAPATETADDPRAITSATAALPPALVGVEWERIPTKRHVVALTFDAGANAAAVPSILATLRAQDVPATFFLTGSWVRRYPVRTRRIVARYPVGNHSNTHPDFTTLTVRRIRQQILATDAAITAAGGSDARPLFRFPFGARDERTINAVNGLGYGSIRWTVDTLGWKGTSSGMTATRVVNRVAANVRPGTIVLMHVGSNPTDGSMLDAKALPRIIELCRSRGYRFVTLRRALAWE
jgi:peptidoglycan/xylan/chitin deacetylase (PgdA/CDA1 family)